MVWIIIRPANHENTSLGESVQLIEVLKREYFVAQTDFKTLESNISLEELSESQLAAFSEDIEKVKENLEVEKILAIESEDIYEWKKENAFEGIILVPVERADFRLKTMAVEDIFIWEEVGLSEYPLTILKVVRIERDQLNNFNQCNFDSSEIVTYVAGGEVIPARAVARKFRRTGDYTFPFHKVQELFVSADFSSIILENSISGSPEPCYGCTWFKGDEAFIQGLEYLGVDVISPGNHMLDGGHAALGRTIEVLDGAHILHTGFSTLNQDEASEPAIYEVDGFRVAFLGYDDVAWFHWAGATWGGVATVSQRFENGTKKLLVDKIAGDVALARQQADFVVVLMSWGDREYINYALLYQKEMAHAFIDNGADMIVGTHPHWVGEVEFYKGKPVFYSLGNFVFDHTHTDPTRQGILLKFYFFQKNLVSVKIIPHQACGPQQSAVDDENCNHFQPQILEESDPVYEVILDRMFAYSDI